MVGLVDALNSGTDENGLSVYPDQDMSDAVNLAMTPAGEPVVFHDLGCTASNDGVCSQACVYVGIKETDSWDDEPTEPGR